MRIFFIAFVASVLLLSLSCSEDSPESPQETGILVVRSTPSGARIYFQGVNTGKNTPDTLTNLAAGDYDLFLYLQYYDTAYFTATIYKNAVTTKEIILEDGLPFVEILIDYTSAYNGDSVQFFYSLNQDVLMDSIIVRRPITQYGSYTNDNYNFSGQLFSAFDQFSNPIRYYLPPVGFGDRYYVRFENLTYWIYFYGHKAYGAKSFFYISLNYVFN
jgi:hypothetical protein